jgi:hypothetical protein
MTYEKNGIFYHYTSVNGLCGIIENSCIHATHISYLNDPSEEEYFQTILEILLIQDKVIKDIYSILYNRSYENSFANYEKFIISFCELSDSLPMWNYYSRGNGYNLGLHLDNIIKRTKEIENLYSFKSKIVYDHDEQLKILSKIFKKHKNKAEKYRKLSAKMVDCQRLNNENDYQLYSYEQSELIASFMDELSIIKKMVKHPSYSNEREVRLIIETDEEYNQIYYRNSSNGCIIPFIKIPISLNEDIFSITLHPLQNNLGLNGLKHLLNNKHINLKENVSISEIPYREL